MDKEVQRLIRVSFLITFILLPFAALSLLFHLLVGNTTHFFSSPPLLFLAASSLLSPFLCFCLRLLLILTRRAERSVVQTDCSRGRGRRCVGNEVSVSTLGTPGNSLSLFTWEP